MAVELTFAERRVLGVLIEKGFTTPDQYPLTLNGVVVGSNQKSCRDPVTSLDEKQVLETLDSLRKKGFAILVRTEGSRADRWKHRTGERLEIEPKDVAVLAELLLRGPQTDGEVRQRATRMVTMGELDEVIRILEGLAAREEPLVELLAPERRRGAKYAHTFYPPAERPGAEGPGPEAERSPYSREPVVGRQEAGPPPPTRTGSEPRPAPSRWEPTPAGRPASGNALPDSGSAPPTGALEEALRRIQALEERVEELEATFVKFLR